MLLIEGRSWVKLQLTYELTLRLEGETCEEARLEKTVLLQFPSCEDQSQVKRVLESEELCGQTQHTVVNLHNTTKPHLLGLIREQLRVHPHPQTLDA